MTDKPKQSSAKVKVKRTRTRLYENEPPKPSPEAGATESKQTAIQPVPSESKLASANRTIHRYVAYSTGTALLPIPFVDMVAVTAIELRMLKRLSDHYGMDFSKQRGKALIGSLIGGGHAGLLANSLLKTVPIFGLGAALVPMAVAAGALTYAVGKVFVFHFETGGTLLDFDPVKFRTFLDTQIEEGKTFASKLKNGKRGV